MLQPRQLLLCMRVKQEQTAGCQNHLVKDCIRSNYTTSRGQTRYVQAGMLAGLSNDVAWQMTCALLIAHTLTKSVR